MIPKSQNSLVEQQLKVTVQRKIKQHGNLDGALAMIKDKESKNDSASIKGVVG